MSLNQSIQFHVLACMQSLSQYLNWFQIPGYWVLDTNHSCIASELIYQIMHIREIAGTGNNVAITKARVFLLPPLLWYKLIFAFADVLPMRHKLFYNLCQKRFQLAHF